MYNKEFNDLMELSVEFSNLASSFERKVEPSKIILLNTILWFENRLNYVPESPALHSLNDIEDDLIQAEKHLDLIHGLIKEYVAKVYEIPSSKDVGNTFLEMIDVVNRIESAVKEPILYDNVIEAINKMQTFGN